MLLSELLKTLDDIAPTQNAESWDNVGLLAGDPAQEVNRAILTIDYTQDVAEEANRLGCDLVIAYHPPIFEAIKRLTAGSLVFDAIRRGVAIYSPHTALDIAHGGTNDMLADAVGLVERSPLKRAAGKVSHCKLVVFVPEEAAERVASTMFDAGAGQIGNYSRCSFRTNGTGTFLGGEGAQPAIGKVGELETVAEIRLETVVPINRIDHVVAAMRNAHPYEEPALDLLQWVAPSSALGMGRIGTLAAAVPASEVFDRIKRELSLNYLLIAGPRNRAVQRIAVCAGACGNLLDEAISQKADLYLTGEMRHHDAIKAAKAGLTVVCALHSNSERAVLKRVRDRLLTAHPALSVAISAVDRDPFTVL